MKNRALKISSVLALATVVVAGSMHVAHAQSIATLFGFPTLMDILNYMIAWLFNAALTICGFILTLSGLMLNYSIGFTLQIRDFVDNAPGIFSVWKALRDISGLFFIFFLLYAAFMMIIGRDGGNFGYKNVIFNVVVAGILINFSFFLAGLGIDASNIVSVELYNQIAPAQSLADPAGFQDSNAGHFIKSHLGDGGIADIFMTSLKITNIYSSSVIGTFNQSGGAVARATGSQTIRIFASGFIGIMIELTAAVSFAAAAVAFLARFVILVFLLAFSPIWFLGFLPRIGDYTSEWKKYYTSMLLFMPVYLLLMYFAMTVITTTPLFANFDTVWSPATGTHWYTDIMALGINAVMILFILNLPLAAAIKIVGDAPLVGKAIKGIPAWANLKKNVYGRAGGFVGRATVGTAALNLKKRMDNSRMFGGTVLGREFTAATAGAVAKKKFGGAYSAEEYNKEKKEALKKRNEIGRGETLDALLAGKTLKGKGDVTLESVMKSMSEKEKIAALSLRLKSDKDKQQALNVIKNLSDSQFESIKKSDDFTDDQKQKVTEYRKAALKDSVANGESTAVKNMVKNISGKDLANYDELLDPLVIGNLTIGQLKSLEETELDTEKRTLIARTIANWKNNPLSNGRVHPAYGWLQKNGEEWGVTIKEAGKEYQGGEPENLPY